MNWVLFRGAPELVEKIQPDRAGFVTEMRFRAKDTITTVTLHDQKNIAW